MENSIRPSSNGASESKEAGKSGQVSDFVKREAKTDDTGSNGVEGGGCIKLINQTKIDSNVIRAVIRFVRPPGIKGFEVIVRNRKGGQFSGRGGKRRIVIRIDTKYKYPSKLHVYQYGQLKAKWTKADPVTGLMRQLKGRRYYLASIYEVLIYLIAHELMHTKQGQRGNVRGRVWGARGRFSEIETESYAIRKLREYRRLARL